MNNTVTEIDNGLIEITEVGTVAIEVTEVGTGTIEVTEIAVIKNITMDEHLTELTVNGVDLTYKDEAMVNHTISIDTYTKAESDTLLDGKADLVHSHSYNDLTNKPTIPTLISQLTNDSGFTTFSGSYTDLTNKPNLFDGNYNSLTNKPTIPTLTSQLTNDVGYLTDNGITITSTSVTDGVNTFDKYVKPTSEPISYIDGLQTALDDKSDTTHNHNLADLTEKSYNSLTDKPTIPTVPTNVSAFTNDSGYLTSETNTTLSLVANTLTYTDETGTPTNIDLSLYLDDTNLARIISGVYDAPTQSLIFTRDDASTFSIDASMFFDDTNLVTSVSGRTGAVTIGISDIANLQTTLDGKITKVASTDNAVVRFNGTSGDIQNTPNLSVNDSGFISLGTATGGEYPASLYVRNNSVVSTKFFGDSIRMTLHITSGGWARSLLEFYDNNNLSFWKIGAFGSGQGSKYGYLGVNYDNTAIKWAPASNTETIARPNSVTIGFDTTANIPNKPLKVAVTGVNNNAFIVDTDSNVIIGTSANNGTDKLQVNGSIIATSYKSSDGSSGATGSFTSSDGKTITVKNGLITSIA